MNYENVKKIPFVLDGYLTEIEKIGKYIDDIDAVDIFDETAVSDNIMNEMNTILGDADKNIERLESGLKQAIKLFNESLQKLTE